MATHITWHNTHITKEDRSKLTRQRPCILWFTGLSGSGKSTIAAAVEALLYKNGNFTYLLDGDNVRHGLNSDLGFDEKSRVENIRRIAEVAKLFVDSGLIVLCSFISPYKKDRKKVRDLVGVGEFIEIFVDTPLKVCEQRDPKGLYKKARVGEIVNFTGIDAPYEKPKDPEVYIKNDDILLEEVCMKVIHYLKKNNYIQWRNDEYNDPSQTA